MAPKRSAPPPSPPPAASSEETAYGSGSEESEEEEEIAHWPPPAAPKMTAPLQIKGQESEGSEEEEDDDEEEEEEEEDDDEEEKKVNHVAPSPATKNPSPTPPKREVPDTSSGGEEEETDDEVPEPKPALIHGAEAEGKDVKPSLGEDKKPGAPFQRTWSTDDEVRILEAMAAHRREHGTLPQADALAAALAGSLDNSGCSPAGLQGRINALKRRYNKASKKGELPTKDHDRRLYDLAKSVWGSVAAAANGGARRDFDEMCELYPFLAEEVRALQRAHNGTFKREFEMMDDDKARALDAKIKRQRVHEIKLHKRRQDLNKELRNTTTDLVEHCEGVAHR